MSLLKIGAVLLVIVLSPRAVGAIDAPPGGAAAATAPAASPEPNAAAAASAAAPKEASIPFANHGGIYNWGVVDNRTLLIQGRNRKWYKATLFAPCIDLPFAQTIGFKTNASGSFDKFSSIVVRRQRCSLTSLVEIPPPVKKPNKSHKMPNDATAPGAASTSPPQ
jgi:hypothetical protein